MSRLLIVLTTLAVFLSAMPWETAFLPEPTEVDLFSVTQVDSLPCPEPVTPGDPCPDGCLCLCCPTNSGCAAFHDRRSSLIQRPQGQNVPAVGLHLPSGDFSSLIYHPPRAA